jgi:hypothetical protein|tara:strand:- start:1452 stop:1895 length:444 start_codon:yes stop_codon:yes gene_type:complete
MSITPTTTNITASAILANLKAKEDTKEDAPVEAQFQQYKSARPAVRLVTYSGLRLTFTNFQFLTQSEEAIDYLDSEIAKGLQGISKGDVLTTSDLDPMQSMRKQVRAELLAEIQAAAANEAVGKSRDMGETENKAKISPASTKQVAS